MHFDNLVFILLVLVALLFRWLTSAANKAAKKSDESTPRSTSTPRTTAPVPRAPAESDEDRIRKFLEALGQPAGSRPPPIVQPRTDVPLRPVAPVQPPLSPFSIPQGRLARKILPRETPKAPPQEKPFVPFVPQAAAPPVFEVEAGTPTAPPAVVKTPAEAYAAVTQEKIPAERKELILRLKSAAGLREGIILREIFGPPRSLQPLDAIGSA
jgi:hypothetical protein